MTQARGWCFGWVAEGHILSVPFPMAKDERCSRQGCKSPFLCQGSTSSERFMCKWEACGFWELNLVPVESPLRWAPPWVLQSIPGLMLLLSWSVSGRGQRAEKHFSV